MGCGASAQETKESKPAAKYDEKEDRLAGKDRYLGDVGAAAYVVEEKKVEVGILLCFLENGNVTFSYKNSKTEKIFAASFDDDQFLCKIVEASITHKSNAIFKSLVTEITKQKVKISATESAVNLAFNITSVKDQKNVQVLPVTLEQCLEPVAVAHYKYVILPLINMVRCKRQSTEENERELKVSRLQMHDTLWGANMKKNRDIIQRIQAIIVPLREESSRHAKQSAELVARIAQTERRIRKLHMHGEKGKNNLDGMYDEGGARMFAHLPEAEEHFPAPKDFSELLSLDWIQQKMPLADTDGIESILRAPTDPKFTPLLNSSDGRLVQDEMAVYQKIDEWDMSVFELEKATNHTALFHVTYAMLYKLDLVRHFGIDDRVLRNFLSAVQAGYHPNPYHNSTHAADVAQINYFIMNKGGLIEKCKLSKEEVLGGILAGSIHDFDHPGFNNNYHTRTNAYLSTLYNDRSILENHHLACVYEIMRKPKYDFTAGMSEEQKREIRDTMVEMVLATDMGNHAKIFSAFRRRLNEGGDWHERKEDVRLALSMSIKMADVSNCGRPKFLYLEWAKNIASEFYNQGDAEAKMCLTISPFMDRKKDKTDFPKGQISFMNYVVVPMFEAIAELFPPVECALQYCTENKEYWQQQE